MALHSAQRAIARHSQTKRFERNYAFAKRKLYPCSPNAPYGAFGERGITHENTPFFRRVLSIQAQCCEAASGLHSFAKIGRPSQNAGA